MSGIYGFVRFDGAPVNPDLPGKMREAMACYGPDGGGAKTAGCAAMGLLLLASTPESVHERQPLCEAGVLLVAAARLDNRDELLETFGVPPELRPVTPDGRLVFLAYLKWRRDSPSQLRGDWAFAAWEEEGRTLFLARDALGNMALYYQRNRHGFAFASNLKALLAIQEAPCAVDLERIAQVIVGYQCDLDRTTFEGLKRVPWAHCLTVREDGMQVQRYRGLPDLGSLRLAGDQDYLDAFMELFQRAVRVRLRTDAPIAATLSGGLDSGSVVALAAPMLAEQGRPLLALTSVPQFEPSLAGARRTGDEWALAERTAHRAGPNVQHVPVRAEGRSFLGSLDRLLAIHHAPGQASGNYYWIDAILEEASRRGCRVVLTGALGNGGVSWQGSGSVALRLLQGQFSGALATLRYNAGSPWAVLKRQVIKPLALPLLRMKRYYLGGRENLWVTQSAIHPVFAARLGIARRLRQAGFEPTGTPSCLEDVRPLLFGTVTQVGCDMWHELASAHGLDVRDPTADLELMEFCLKVPDEQYVRQGKGRLLLRRAMAGRLPGEVLDNETKGLQAADLEARILQEQRAVAEVLKRMEASEACCACLDLDRMETLLASLHKGSVSRDKWRSMGALCRGLAAGKFLLNFY